MSVQAGAQDLRQRIEQLARAFSIDLVFLFGSQKNEGLAVLEGKSARAQDALSDLDIGVVFAPGAFPARPFEVFGPLYAEFQEIFHPLRPDLVFLEETESTFQFEAIRGACVYCSDKEILENYVEQVLRTASDWIYMREMIDREYLSGSKCHGE